MVTVPFKFPSCQVFLRETRDKGTHRIIASKPARTQVHHDREGVARIPRDSTSSLFGSQKPRIVRVRSGA